MATLFDITGPYTRTMHSWIFDNVLDGEGKPACLTAATEALAKTYIQHLLDSGKYTKKENKS